MILSEAEDYVSVKPSRSIELLNNDVQLSLLNEKDQIRWHIANIRASVATSKMDVLRSAIEQLLVFKDHPYFEKRLASVLSGVGIWLRKSGYLTAARLSFECALKYANSSRSRVISLISIALVSRHLNNLETAKTYYSKAKKEARKHQLTGLVGTIENNLGVIALEENNLDEAELHFRKSMLLNQRISKRSGHILAGINLLQVFLVKNDLVNYQRLYPTISRLAAAFPDENKNAHLLIVNSAYSARTGNMLSEQDNADIVKAFDQLQSAKLQQSLKQHFEKDLVINLNVREPPKQLTFKESWLENIKQCDWSQLTTIISTKTTN